MADVRILIGGRAYDVHCADGQEAQLQALAALVDEKVQAVPGGTETRQLLFAALMLADARQEAEQKLADALPAVETVTGRLAALQQREAEARHAAELAEADSAALREEAAALRAELDAATTAARPDGAAPQPDAALAQTLDGIAERIDRITLRLTDPAAG